MKLKLIWTFLCMLLITTIILPVSGTINIKNEINEEEKTTNAVDDVDWWPMFRHDAANTGCTSSEAPETNEVKWKVNIGDEIYTGVPIIVENKLFISTNYFYDIQPPEPPPAKSSEKQKSFLLEKPCSLSEVFETMNAKREEYIGGIYCLDSETGESIWDYQMFGPNNPAVIDDRVYLTDGSYYYISTLYCLHAETGNTIWEKPIDGWVTTSTIVADEKIYFGSLDIYGESGKFYCYDLNGHKIWDYSMPQYEFMFFTAPAVYDGKVYFFTLDLYSYGEGNLYCLNAETGQFIWSKPISSGWYYFFASTAPVCADDKVFAIDMDFYNYEWDLKCLNAANGKQEWSYDIGLSFGSPVYFEDSLYLTGFNADDYYTSIYEINATTGKVIWKAPVPDIIFSSPVLADNMIYLCSSGYYHYSRNIYCLDADDGGIIWTYTLDFPSLSTLSIANELAYVPDSMGNIYAFKTNYPPGNPSIDGPLEGTPGEAIEYIFKSIDPDGDNVYYFIYWGDGTFVTWDGPHQSGEEITISHTWEEQDTYNISAKVKDDYGKMSEWATLEVTMPRNRISSESNINLFLNRLIQRFPFLEELISLIIANNNIIFNIGGRK